MATHNIQTSSFNLADDVDDDSVVTDPIKLLALLNEKYHRQKVLYYETRNYYYKLNLFVFFLPLLIVQGLTTVLTHMSSNNMTGYHDEVKIVVATLNGLSSVWAAAQLKLGWNHKRNSANSTLIKYRDMSAHVAMFYTIMNCQKQKSMEGVVEFVESCYQNEQSIMQNEIMIPTFIAKAYDENKITPDNTLGKMEKLVVKQMDCEDTDPSQGGKKNQKKGKDGTTELNEGGWTKDIEKHPKSADTFLSHHMPSSSSTQVHVESEDKPAEKHDKKSSPSKVDVPKPKTEDTKPETVATPPAAAPATTASSIDKFSDKTEKKDKSDKKGKAEKGDSPMPMAFKKQFSNYEADSEGSLDGDEDSNMNATELFRKLLGRYRALKWLYGNAARYYYFLNLGCFYSPLVLLSTLATILSSLVATQESNHMLSLFIIKVSAIISILTGLQMTLQWESESANCDTAHEMYRKLDSELSYRLMLADQGLPVKNSAKFAWKCRDIEDQTLGTEPSIPDFIVAQVNQEALQEQKRLIQTVQKAEKNMSHA